jgi:2-iminoacetate synthase
MDDQIIKLLQDKKLDGNCNQYRDQMNALTAQDVSSELAKLPGKYSLQRLMTLLSPAAGQFLETMAQQARDLTIQRFGRTIQLYAPLYLSNYCINTCLYCGYNCRNNLARTRLTIEQAVADADIIASEGFRHILLVSGEDPKYITTDYLTELAAQLRKKFSSIGIEIFPLSTEQYRQCFNAGIEGVTLYQEAYNREVYSHYHQIGPKSDYENRLLSPDRFASAGMRRIGMGVLLGLDDWRTETLALAEHAHYLIKKYWQAKVAFSFPRLRPAANVAHEYQHLVSDAQMLQMTLALRLCFADTEIVLSTRENAQLRDNMIGICMTRISAGSKTSPGGYSAENKNLEQFQIDDTRTPAEVALAIRKKNCEPVWKDWDTAFVK